MPGTRAALLAILLLSAMAAGQTTRPMSIEEKLAVRIPELKLDGLTVTEALTAIADSTRLNILPEWTNLANLGVLPDHKLRGRLYDITVRQAILVVLLDAGAKSPPDLVTDDDVLKISGPKATVTRVYPVGKLLDALLRRPTTMPAGNDPADPQSFEKAVLEAVMQIDPESWRDAGGIVGSMHLFGRKLIITQTPDAHEKIVQLLKDLEKPDAQ